MNKLLLIAIMAIVYAVPGMAQNPDAVTGIWSSPHGSGRIQIYKKGAQYFGKLVWIKEPNDENGKPKHDIHNPNKNLRSAPVIGLDVLKNFKYDDGEWVDGTAYDPKSGKTYSCKMSLENPDRLNIRGYIGISLLGRTETWSRVK